MKLKFLSVAAMVLLATACKKGTDSPADNQWATGTNPLATDISQWLVSNAPPPKIFTYPNASGYYAMNDSIAAYFPPSIFVRTSGAAFSGSVTLKMQTVTTVGNMLFSGITTVAGTRMLSSGGMFKIEAYDSTGTALIERNNNPLSVSFFSTAYDTSYKMFSGTAVAQNSNQMDWIRNDSAIASPAQGPNGVGGVGTFSYGSKLFTWSNLDQYMNGSPLTDISVTVPAGFGNLNTMCAFKYTGRTSCAYLPPNAAIQAFSTQGSGYKMIVGNGAKIICMAKKDGKFYYQVVNVSSISLNQSISVSSLTEVSEAALKTVIAGF